MKPSAIANTEKALLQLEEFIAIENPSKIEFAGVIQAFEFTYERLWKTLKTYLFDQGFQSGSPKQVFKDGFKSGLIKDQNIWLKMLQDRNLTVHTYNEALAKEIYQRIKSNYAPEMRIILELLKKA